jgi:hypothetical protein
VKKNLNIKPSDRQSNSTQLYTIRGSALEIQVKKLLANRARMWENLFVLLKNSFPYFSNFESFNQKICQSTGQGTHDTCLPLCKRADANF